MSRSNVEVVDGRCEVHGEHRGHVILVSSLYNTIGDDWTAQVDLW